MRSHYYKYTFGQCLKILPVGRCSKPATDKGGFCHHHIKQAAAVAGGEQVRSAASEPPSSEGGEELKGWALVEAIRCECPTSTDVED